MSVDTLLRTAAATRIYVSEAPQSGTEPVRRMDLSGLLSQSGTLPPHAHVPDDVSGFDARVRSVSGVWLINGTTVRWVDSLSGRQAQVILASGTGILASPAGLALDFGAAANQPARGNHTHDLLHEPVTGSGTGSVEMVVVGQRVAGNIRLRPSSGLVIGPDGLGVDFGGGSAQVPPGNHTHSGTSHPAAASVSTPSLAIWVNSEMQVISGTVRLNGNPMNGFALAVDADGVFLPKGSGTQHAAPFEHVHAAAGSGTSGFLTASDYNLLRRMQAAEGTARTPQGSAHWQQWDAAPAANGVLPGRRQWTRPVQVQYVRATAQGGTGSAATELALLWDGADTGERLVLPVAPGGAEVDVGVSLPGIVVPPGTGLRWRVVSTASDAADRHRKIDIGLAYDALADPLWRLNCGGAAIYPWLAERLSNGGSNSSTATAINRTGVASPAPEAVYQSCRVRTDSQPLVYEVDQLLVGVSYRVRLHWADIGAGLAAGICVMDVQLTGATVVSLSALDVYVAAGGTYRAHAWEGTVAPDSDGSIEIRLTPNGATTRAFLSAIEVTRVV